MRFPRILAYSAVSALLAVAGACFPVSPDVEEASDAVTPLPAAPEPLSALSGEEEKRNAQENRRRTHLHVIRLSIDRSRQPEIRIAQRQSSPAISRFTFDRNVSGTYYVTKQGVLLCEEGPCSIEWTVKFLYTDENGKHDAFLLQDRETVYGGMGPTGTGKRRMDWCLNGDCREVKDIHQDELKQEVYHERYALFLAKGSLIIRRADIMKEVLNAGRKLSEY